MIYLMDFDPERRRLHAMKVFDDQQRRSAQDEGLALELVHLRTGDEREVILLSAADEATLRRTHARYFESTDAVN
ncbi:hypothetical protein [Roseateles sp.]|uniref:hypothetical protein n=1 Tax=Roseateles sp. TaxID=1971397 RepID=UPI0032641F4E